VSRLRRAALAGALASLLSSCGPSPAALTPLGPGAARIVGLFELFLVVLAVPAAITIGLLVLAAVRRRDDAARPASLAWIVFGTLVTVVVLVVLLVASVRVGAEVARPPGPTAVTIDVRGHQFWWEVRYPDLRISTANEIHIPAGRPVRLRLTSADVIHNFWVPELHGKMDMVPGHTNIFWIQADHPGRFVGRCAEFCGVQHALMAVIVVAEPQESFDAWAAAQRAPAAAPVDAEARRGLEVYLGAACGHCHAIGGVTPPLETGAVGPDLTHLASRGTLAAATLANNRGNLAGWILNPHDHKPGSRMPASSLTPGDLMALLSYLEGLR